MTRCSLRGRFIGEWIGGEGERFGGDGKYKGRVAERIEVGGKRAWSRRLGSVTSFTCSRPVLLGKDPNITVVFCGGQETIYKRVQAERDQDCKFKCLLAFIFGAS